jgi:DNA mismatch repair protein MutL
LADIIELLPENIANQIAAGEVIQRPASAVKELMENAVDAGATEIKLFVNDSGKSLIQVTDNGKGMSESDARMCFERHATSKIKKIDDLFHIRTMGFRGEALASIAAVAQVELKTKTESDETGTYIEIENSAVTDQRQIAFTRGTSIAMKNLFFNVPARRNFLKSNPAEMRHIVEEFIRIALAFPEVFFSLTSNGQEIFHLEKGTLKQRIVQVLGSQYNARLVSVQEKTDYLNIYGFVGKPETAKKTRGDQYLFVNNRFIRSAYLNHAIMGAYHEMIPADSFPLFVLFIDLDPSQIDVNVHPTKQEIKFEDEKIVYAFVQAAVKHALAQFSVTPTLDFELDPAIQNLHAISRPVTEEQRASVSSSPLFNTFSKKNQAHFIERSDSNFKPWSAAAPANETREDVSHAVAPEQQEFHTIEEHTFRPIQIANAYIIASSPKGFIVVNQQLAHERILYERLSNAFDGKPVSIQRSLFPVTIDLSPQDAVILHELLGELHFLGYHIESFGKESFIIQGTPADLQQGYEKNIIESMIEQYKHFTNEIRFSKREKLIRTVAMQQSIRTGQSLTEKEMHSLVYDLFQCSHPNSTANGAPTYIEFKVEHLEYMFKK